MNGNYIEHLCKCKDLTQCTLIQTHTLDFNTELNTELLNGTEVYTSTSVCKLHLKPNLSLG